MSHPKRTCPCGRPAVFRYRGRVRSDDDHKLCPRCWRDWNQRMRAWRMKCETQQQERRDQ